MTNRRYLFYPIWFPVFKMSYRYLFFALFGLLAAGRAQAQTNFRPGYVLPLAGDTLRGEVDLRDGRANAERCRFRANAQAAVTTYSPAELRGYGFAAGRKHYRAVAVALAPAAPQPYFLEVLADGPAALYFLRDAEQHELFFVASPALPLAPLEHSTARVVRDGQIYTEEQNPYRTTLATALAGCPAAQSLLPHLLFQESALRRVVELYNACSGAQPASASPDAAVSRAVLGLMGGVALHHLSYDGVPYEKAGAVSNHTGFAFGPTVRINTGRLSQKISVVLAVLYEAEKFDLESQNLYNGAPNGVFTRTHIDLAYLRVPVMFRYTYPRGKVTPLAELGFTAAYALKTDNTTEQATATGYFMKPQPLLAGEQFRSLQLGLGAGLGASLRTAGGRNVAVLARAETTNGFSNVTGISTSVLHVYGLLSVDLTKK